MNTETKKRRLKVYYGHHGNSYKQHPVIRLAGEYLKNSDFKIGDTVEITVELGRINITKLPNE
jgi:hypothetical protein